MDYEQIVCQRLKMLREMRDLRQIDMAEILKVSKSTYSQYEAGKRKITINTLCKIADEFDITLDWFVGRDIEVTKKIKNS